MRAIFGAPTAPVQAAVAVPIQPPQAAVAAPTQGTQPTQAAVAAPASQSTSARVSSTRARGAVLGTVLGAAPADARTAPRPIARTAWSQRNPRSVLGAAGASAAWADTLTPIPSRIDAVRGSPLPPQPPLPRPHAAAPPEADDQP